MSNTRTSFDDSQTVRKTQVSSKGVVFREIPAPASPQSKKKRAHDVAKHITEERYKWKFIVRDDLSENKAIPETPLVSTSLMVISTPIISSVSYVTTVEPTVTIPLEIMVSKSVTEEAPISNINANVSNMGVHVSVDILQPISLSSSLPLITSSSLASLPPFILPIFTVTTSPIFDNILQQPITTLFPSQSTEPSKPHSDDETDEGGFGGTFDDLHFNSEEEDIPDHMLMSGKQFKILNRKLNSILQS